MVDSMVEQLRADMRCENLLACFHGLKPLDRECYQAFVAAEEPLTVDDTADAVDRERSTAYRSVQRLLQTGFLEKEQINYDAGGYSVDPRVRGEVRRRYAADSRTGTLNRRQRRRLTHKPPVHNAASTAPDLRRERLTTTAA